MIYTAGYQDTVDSVSERFGISKERLISDNGLIFPYRLAPGQALLVLIPYETYTVEENDTLASISDFFNITVNELLAKNPTLKAPLTPGEEIVISYRGESQKNGLYVYGYAYAFIDDEKLDRTLPYLSSIIPFTYGFTREGRLIPTDDENILRFAEKYGILPVMHLSTLTDGNVFDNTLSAFLLDDQELQTKLIGEILSVIRMKKYYGIDVDFEYLGAEYAVKYAVFTEKLKSALSPYGYRVTVALAPKSGDDQSGLLYEGHDYTLLGAAADRLLLMTYEWGYAYSEPQAVAPITEVRKVLDYAASRIYTEKLLLGIPNYGYDWQLPYSPGITEARSLSNTEAAFLAGKYSAQIIFDEESQSPHFNYTDENGIGHEVFFEDVRSIDAKLKLVREYSLGGVGVWNIMRDFPAMWLTVENGFGIIRNN